MTRQCRRRRRLWALVGYYLWMEGVRQVKALGGDVLVVLVGSQWVNGIWELGRDLVVAWMKVREGKTPNWDLVFFVVALWVEGAWEAKVLGLRPLHPLWDRGP